MCGKWRGNVGGGVGWRGNVGGGEWRGNVGERKRVMWVESVRENVSGGAM